MTDTPPATAALSARTRSIAAGGPVVAVHFLQDTAAFVLGEEALLLVAPEGEARRVAVHGGAILASTRDGNRLVTGGDDGKVLVVDDRGNLAAVASDAK